MRVLSTLKPGCCDIAVLAELPAPYYVPAWNHLARLTGGSFSICFLSLTNSNRRWELSPGRMNFDWRVLGGEYRGSFLWDLRKAAAMAGFLISRHPRAVICAGYDSLAAWVTLVWCKLFRRRVVLWSESNARDHRPSSALRTWLKGLFVSKCDAVAVLGNAASEYARKLGARGERIFVVPFGGNSNFFATEAQKVDSAVEKRRRGWPPRLILYSGRLIREKGVFILLKAFKQISHENPDVGLLFVGHGSAELEMMKFCCEAELDRVYFVGAQEYERMPYFYALADILVLPTFSDPYGYVVIEAFACGIPAIVSSAAGVCDDLIIARETGFAVQAGDSEELAQKIRQLLNDDELRARMSGACRRAAQNFSPEACAEGLYSVASSS
jgi:glycosyltransferase involved in cell wall biosynthesis